MSALFMAVILQNCGIKLSEDEINILLDTLDKDDDGEINYRYV